jgi:hypothetical protein
VLLRLTETHPAVTAKQIDDACNERERQYLEARAAAASRASSRAPLAVRAAAVSRSCACIESPCLRHCVHGASIVGCAGGESDPRQRARYGRRCRI